MQRIIISLILSLFMSFEMLSLDYEQDGVVYTRNSGDSTWVVTQIKAPEYSDVSILANLRGARVSGFRDATIQNSLSGLKIPYPFDGVNTIKGSNNVSVGRLELGGPIDLGIDFSKRLNFTNLIYLPISEKALSDTITLKKGTFGSKCNYDKVDFANYAVVLEDYAAEGARIRKWNTEGIISIGEYCFYMGELPEVLCLPNCTKVGAFGLYIQNLPYSAITLKGPDIDLHRGFPETRSLTIDTVACYYNERSYNYPYGPPSVPTSLTLNRCDSIINELPSKMSHLDLGTYDKFPPIKITSDMQYFRIPKLKEIPKEAFKNSAISVDSIFCENVEKIDSAGFYGNKNLSKIPNFPKLKYIGVQAFDKTNPIENLSVLNTLPVEFIGSYAFASKGTKIPNLNLASCTKIGLNAFCGEGDSAAEIVLLKLTGKVETLKPNDGSQPITLRCPNLDLKDVGQISWYNVGLEFKSCKVDTLSNFFLDNPLYDYPIYPIRLQKISPIIEARVVKAIAYCSNLELPYIDFSQIEEIGDGAFIRTPLPKIVELTNIKKLGERVFASDTCEMVTLGENFTELDDKSLGRCRFNTLQLKANQLTITDGAFKTLYADSIQNLVLHSTTVPTLNNPEITSDIFDNLNVYVPRTALEDYKKDFVFGMFAHIYPLDEWVNPGESTIINNDLVQSPHISATQGGVSVTGDEPVAIYNIDGRMVYRGSAGIINLPSGMYIVKCGSLTQKVIL